MNKSNFKGYKVKGIIQDQDDSCNDIIKHLSSILNDRSIPESQKQLVKMQFDEIMRLKNVTMKPPTIILEKG